MSLLQQKLEKEAIRELRMLKDENYYELLKRIFIKGANFGASEMITHYSELHNKSPEDVTKGYEQWEAGFNRIKDKNAPFISRLRENMSTMKGLPPFSDTDLLRLGNIQWLYNSLHRHNRRHELYADTIDILDAIIKNYEIVIVDHLKL